MVHIKYPLLLTEKSSRCSGGRGFLLLLCIISTLDCYNPFGVYCRQDETVLRRSRIGHTFYTHSYILKGEDRPWCVGCDEDITVKHILLDCVDFSDQRPRFYSLPNLKHLFTQVPGHQILSFLKAIGLYGKFKINYRLHQTINSYT